MTQTAASMVLNRAMRAARCVVVGLVLFAAVDVEARPRLGRPLTRPEMPIVELPKDLSLLAFEERDVGTELEFTTALGLHPRTRTFGLTLGAAVSLKWAFETEVRLELEATQLGRGESTYGFKPAIAVRPPLLQATFFEWAIVPSLVIVEEVSSLIALEGRLGLARLESSRIELGFSAGPTFAEAGTGYEGELIGGAIWAFREGREIAFGMGVGARKVRFEDELQGFGRFELNYFIDPMSLGFRVEESIGAITGPGSIGMLVGFRL